MSRRRPLSAEERALWAGFARSITPLHRAQAPAAEPEAGSEVLQARSQQVARGAAPSGKQAPPLAPLGRRLKRRLAHGREPIDDRLDLHGFTLTEAHAELLHFLRSRQAAGAKIVLVVTGKGTGKQFDRKSPDATANRGVLRREVRLWLSLPEFRSLIVAFEDAHAAHGGQGALYVRLRRSL